MIDVEDLINLVQNYNPHCDTDAIRRAYAYGLEMHEGQFRKSGEPYFTHPVAVAAILTEQRLDDATIITALLHDTIEDTRSTYGDIKALFGTEVAELVDGVTKLTNLEISEHESKQAENFRKLLIAMSRDLRVILIKLADRLHNMRTIRSMSPEKQIKKARETMDIYAPLAGRMGMQWMREELEDFSFKVLNREARKSIIRRFVNLQRESGDVIAQISSDMMLELEKVGIDAAVYGRAKKPFSIWRKMQEKNLTFSRLSDIYGFRIICSNVPDCYRILGVIHQRWGAVPGRFKDYISQPKKNGYRSIHTTISGHGGKPVEVQIRTHEMHEVAESGIAAHWAYREGVRAQNPYAAEPAKWLTNLAARFNDIDHNEFLEHVKLEMYSDQVFCFSPKGDVIQLPRGATALDFAYNIHTSLGNATVSAKVDGSRVPLWTRLRNGQSVEIITAAGQKPQSSWISIVKTGRAKTAIRRSLREEERDHFIQIGQELLRAAFERLDKRVNDKAMRTAARILGLPHEQELWARIGTAEVTVQQVIQTLYPDLTNLPEIEAEALRSGDSRQTILGTYEGRAFHRADCCTPLPGERIVGIMQEGGGIIAHAIDCPVLEKMDATGVEWLDITWPNGPRTTAYPVGFDLTISNDTGVLGRVCSLIAAHKANISNLTFVDRKPDFYRISIDIELRDFEHMHLVMNALDAENNVAHISRKHGALPKH